MRIAEVEGVGRMEFPDDTPDSVIQSTVQRIVREKNQPEISYPVPSPMARVGRGMMDFYQGAKQKYLNWTDPVEAQRYTQNVNNETALYEKGRKQGAKIEGKDSPGVDWLRFGGTVLTPLSLLPGGGASVPARIGLGALAGGTAGYSLYNPNNDNQSNAINTGVGAVGGGLLNAAAPYVVNAAVKGGQSVINKAGEITRRAVRSIIPDTQITNNVTVALKGGGINFSALAKDVQDDILNQAKMQITATGKLDAAQLIRQAEIDAVVGKGMGTRGQITRDPAQWTLERNLQKSEMNLPAVQRGEVPSITNRLQQQAVGLDRYASGLTDDIYGGVQPATRSLSPLQASERAINAIKSADKADEIVVSRLYDAYRSSGKQNLTVSDVRIADAVGRVSDDIGVENIPPAVMSRLREFGFFGGQRTKLLTVNEADKLTRLINNNNPGFGPQSAALGRIKVAVNEALLDIPDEGAKGLIEAKAAAAARFAEQRAGIGIARALDDVAPDRFFENNILGGNVRDVKAMAKKLRDVNPESWNDLRAHAWQWIVDKASQNGRNPISGAKLDDAVKRVGVDRMRVLFTPEEMAKIDQFRRGALALTQEPAFAAPNRSNTASAMMGQLLQMGNRIPIMNAFTKPALEQIESSTTQRLINQALSGAGVSTKSRDMSQALLRNRITDGLVNNRPVIPGLLAPAYLEQHR